MLKKLANNNEKIIKTKNINFIFFDFFLYKK